MQVVSSAVKRATVAKRKKHAPGAKRGKTCTRCQARENMHPVPTTRKLVTAVYDWLRQYLHALVVKIG